MKVLQSRSFIKEIKKLHKNQKASLDEAINLISKDPLIGHPKKGNLLGVRVYKFQMISLLTLLAYQYDEKRKTLFLLKVGSHENFYRDLSMD